MKAYLLATGLGVLMGTLARYLMLRSDYRQYPTYPHGTVTHLSLGFIAATLGAVALPALAAEEYTAVTFLALAATQFREVRNMEREMLEALEEVELVPRGPAYVEGISRVFEARNYLVMLVALITGGITLYAGVLWGLAGAVASILLANMLMSGSNVGKIAVVREGKVRFEGANLYVEDIHFMNLGMRSIQETVLERGMGVVIEPKDDNARETIANNGQRMAIAHDAASLMGVYRDVDTAEFMPIVRRDLDTGRIALIILPIERDIECLLEAVRRTPVLESALSRPLQSRVGRKAAD